MKKLLFAIILSIICFGILSAQETIRITGKVSGASETLPGVSIVLKGTSTGTVTDADGNYSISARPTDILVFSYVGFVSVEEPVNNRTIINMLLKEEVIGLEEVIAVGYGTVKKKDLTGAISTVKGEELAKRNVSNLTQALQGQLAGVQVISNGGSPGSEASILVRGI